MLILIPSYFLCLGIILTTGVITDSIIRKSFTETKYTPNILHSIIWGIIVITTVTGIYSMFAPISDLYLAGFLMMIAVSSFLVRNELKKTGLSIFHTIRKNLLETVLFVGLLVVICISVNDPLTPNDTGGYHAQAVRWLTNFGVVPGLGNIHARLAFNNHLFVFASFFDAFWMTQNVHLLINGLIFIFGGLVFFKELVHLKEADSLSFTNYLGLSIAIPLLFFEPRYLNTLYVEFSATILTLYTFQQFCTDNASSCHIILLSALTGLLITFKASMLPIILLLLPLIYQSEKEGAFSLKRSFLLLAPFTIVIIPFIARNILISGYPLFPMPFVDLYWIDFDWMLPKDKVDYMIHDLQAWGRTIGKHPDWKSFSDMSLEWIPFWFEINSSRYPRILFFLGCSILYLGYQFVRFARKFSLTKPAVWTCIIPITGIVMWFVSVPLVRLGYPWIFTTFCIATAYGFSLILRLLPSSLTRYTAFLKPKAGIIIGFLFLVITANGAGILVRTIGAEAHLLTQLRSMPANPEVKPLTFDDGKLTVYLATDYGQCWYHKVPCTVEVNGNGVNPHIQLRGNQISDGFQVTYPAD